MAKIIGLPKLSPTMEEGTLVSWAKAEGDSVEMDELLAEVETDKATMEFRSFDKGVLLKILVEEGATLAPDAPVAIIGKAGEDISALVAEAAARGAAPVAEPASPDRKTSVEQPAPVTLAGAKAPSAVVVTAARAPGERVLSSPLVRRLAREHDVDLAQVAGTGPRGRIIKRDIELFLANPRPAAPAPVAGAPGAGFATRLPPVVEKASATRRTIARRLTESKRDVPHYYLSIDVDVAPLRAARKQINAELERDGHKISLNDLIIKACGVALRREPDVNVSWIDGEMHRHQVVDISVAVAIPDGLVTPVVRDADKLGLLAISTEVKSLAQKAKDKKLRLEEMTNGTFSISSLGMFGIEHFTAVINPPEGAILAVGTIRNEPVVVGDAVVPGQRMRMTLSCDHRAIDGAVGAKFLAVLKRLLESPTTLLI